MTTWGATENYCRLGIDAWLDDIDDDGVTIRADIRFYSGVAVTDSSNTLTWGGHAPDGSQTPGMSITNGTGERLLKSIDWWTDRIYGESYEELVTANLGPIEYVGDDYLDVSAYVTVPARPYQTPRPPKTPAVTKNSDTSHTVTWTTDYTANSGGYPWANVRVERSTSGGSWTQIAELSRSTTSYTDTTTVADRSYAYRVRAWNSIGFSSYATTGTTYTTPAAHTNLAWAKTTADVVLTWTKASTLAVQTEVQESAGGGAWTTKATVAAGTNTWTHVAPSTSVTHQYRVRPVISAVTGAWTTSTLVQLLAAPLAPTALTPSGLAVDPDAATITATWTHNPADGTAQTAYEHRVREAGGAWTSSGKITSTTSTRTLTGLTRGKTYEHQVLTYGQHASASPWGAVESFTTGAQPQAGITYPSTADHGTSALTAQWTYYDLEGTAQTAAQVELWDGSTVVYAATLPGVTSHTLPVDLDNLTAYQVKVRVQDSSGLWSPWASVVFSTDFVKPPAPTATGVFDAATGTVTLTIVNPPADGTTTVPAVSNTVHRSIDNGPWELVATNVPIDTTITDRIPSTSGTNAYRITAWSATPTAADSDPVAVVAASPWLYLNGGPGHAVLARLKGGPAVALTAGRTKVLHQFAGRTHPVEFTGTARTRAYDLSGAVDGFGAHADAWGAWEAWEAVADLPAPLLYRDPLGRREHVSISEVKISHGVDSTKAKVSATLTVVSR